MKKITCAIITAVSFLLSFPAVNASDWVTAGDFQYRVTKEYTSIAYGGPGGEVVFPSEINGRPVTRCKGITNPVRNAVTSVTIPEGITHIADNAFENCTNLFFVNLPESLEEIGEDAFARCDSLAEITIPEGVTSIGRGAFSICTSLTTVNIKNRIIGKGMFFRCAALKTLNISENVAYIDDEAFGLCSSLKDIVIPETIKEIKFGAFRNCSDLRSVMFLGTDTSIEGDSVNGIWKAPAGDTFIHTDSLETIYAFPGTKAHTYATDRELRFIPLAYVVLNDELLQFDVPPIIDGDRVLVPLRVIFEALGAEVDWNGETSTVTATTDSVQLILQIGNKEMRIGEETVLLDVPAQIVFDRSVVPVRAVSEGLNAAVEWDAETQTVIIDTRIQASQPTEGEDGADEDSLNTN